MSLAHAPVSDRVRANTWPSINETIDRQSRQRLRHALASSSADELTDRIGELSEEWDFDRVLETEAGLMGLIGLTLGAAVDRRFLVIPAVVSSMLLLHTSHGWYPLLPLFRRWGVRTRDEIDKERYGLKGIRGDFSALPPSGTAVAERAAAAWKAVCA